MTSGPDGAYPKSDSGKPVALEARGSDADGRRHSPSVARNRDPILNVFREHVCEAGHVLEIASGTGEHGAYLTEALDGLHWTYSDIDGESRRSQAAWKAASTHGRLDGPVIVDASKGQWGEVERSGHWDAIVSINMIHIAPFEAALGLVAGAGRLLKPGGKLFLYGPFARNGEIAPSNAAFTESLQSRDSAWGVRDLDRQIIPLAEEVGLSVAKIVDMPANNLSVVFARS
jgi:SAM-dependent methyltransferase